uniref:Lipocalin n=1 Tax=Rhipicephalus zambeziensis TaxID=60191 RepID=A0A224YLK1_9ACAR
MYALQGILIIVAISLCDGAKPECEVSAVSKYALPIVNVFNTSERLWYYEVNSTKAKNLSTCMFLQKFNITEKDYYSWQNESYSERSKLSEPCHGTFRNSTTGDLGAMSLACGDPENSAIKEEFELKYTERNCSVFFVTVPSLHISWDPMRPACRMYIPDDAVDNGPTTNCSDFFNTNCTGKPAVFYNKTCKTL